MPNLVQLVQDNKKFTQESNVEFADGEVIFREGDESREMYVVVTGEVVISKLSPKGDIVLATLKKGEFLGEMSLLESLPRSATSTAKGPTRLLAIHPGGFLLKIRRDPTFAFEMLQSMSRRIRVTNDQLMKELGRGGAQSEVIRRILQDAEYASGEVAGGNVIGPLGLHTEGSHK